MTKKEESYEPFGSSVSEEELAEEYAGLGARVFICKKEDFEKQLDQPLIHESTLIANKPHWIPVDITSDTTIHAEETGRSFKCSFTLVDGKQKHYQAKLLAVAVLPVFSRTMLPITFPHIPFQLRDGYTKLYRNPHNFFYSAMENIYSSSFFRKKSEEEEEQLFEKLETALNVGNLRSIKFRSQLFHRWLKSK